MQHPRTAVKAHGPSTSSTHCPLESTRHPTMAQAGYTSSSCSSLTNSDKPKQVNLSATILRHIRRRKQWLDYKVTLRISNNSTLLRHSRWIKTAAHSHIKWKSTYRSWCTPLMLPRENSQVCVQAKMESQWGLQAELVTWWLTMGRWRAHRLLKTVNSSMFLGKRIWRAVIKRSNFIRTCCSASNSPITITFSGPQLSWTIRAILKLSSPCKRHPKWSQ